MHTTTQRPGPRTGPPTRADFLGWPKGLLPIEEKVRRLESRVKQLEAIAYGSNPPQAWQRSARLKRIVASRDGVPWRYLTGPPTRADFLGWPKGLLPIEEKVRKSPFGQ